MQLVIADNCQNQVKTSLKIKALRQALGVTQEQAGQNVGKTGQLARMYFSNFETGKNQAKTLKAREDIAKGFGLSVDTVNAYLDEKITLQEVIDGKNSGTKPQQASIKDNTITDLERALARVFDGRQHDFSDLDATREVFRQVKEIVRGYHNYDQVALAYLQAAKALRLDGIEANTQNILAKTALMASEKLFNTQKDK